MWHLPELQKSLGLTVDGGIASFLWSVSGNSAVNGKVNGIAERTGLAALDDSSVLLSVVDETPKIDLKHDLHIKHQVCYCLCCVIIVLILPLLWITVHLYVIEASSVYQTEHILPSVNSCYFVSLNLVNRWVCSWPRTTSWSWFSTW